MSTEPKQISDMMVEREGATLLDAVAANCIRNSVSVAAMDRIAKAVCKRVADLDDRTSPDDWPDAMLVTGRELYDIIMQEFDAELG